MPCSLRVLSKAKHWKINPLIIIIGLFYVTINRFLKNIVFLSGVWVGVQVFILTLFSDY
jgi:hypothetical protein